MLVEATAGTWLVGTASEHHTLYAYQFYNAQNVMSAMQVQLILTSYQSTHELTAT